MTSQHSTANLRDIAANLRHLANLFESADLGDLPAPVTLKVHIGPSVVDSIGKEAAVKGTVELLSTVVGARPEWDEGSGDWATYRAMASQGVWTLLASAFLPRSVTREQQLADEVEQLRAELAASRAAVAAPPTA